MFERKKPSGKLLSLPIDQIHPSPFQARKSFDEQELTALAQSIRENGLLQPVTVRRAAEGYELVAGERRLRACQLAKIRHRDDGPFLNCGQNDPVAFAFVHRFLPAAESGARFDHCQSFSIAEIHSAPAM